MMVSMMMILIGLRLYQRKWHWGWLQRRRGRICCTSGIQSGSRCCWMDCIGAPANKQDISSPVKEFHTIPHLWCSTHHPLHQSPRVVGWTDQLWDFAAPWENLLCPEQHFWKVQRSRCICTGIIMMILMVIVCMIVLQLDDGSNNYHKCGHDLCNSGDIIA